MRGQTALSQSFRRQTALELKADLLFVASASALAHPLHVACTSLAHHSHITCTSLENLLLHTHAPKGSGTKLPLHSSTENCCQTPMRYMTQAVLSESQSSASAMHTHLQAQCTLTCILVRQNNNQPQVDSVEIYSSSCKHSAHSLARADADEEASALLSHLTN